MIKMIAKGRGPTMRHVSRTHRVALDWLFDRINLDRKIQIRYMDTKHKLADILTKGNFTRDGWNNLLQLFNIGFVPSRAFGTWCPCLCSRDAPEVRLAGHPFLFRSCVVSIWSSRYSWARFRLRSLVGGAFSASTLDAEKVIWCS